MITGTEHFIYIAGAYAGVAIMVLGLIAYVVRDARGVAARLDALDKAGIRRRSQR